MFVRPQRFRRWLFCRLPREDAAADYECGHDCPENPKLHLLHFGVLRRPSPLRPIIRRSAYQVLRSSPGSVAKLAAMRRASSLVSLSVTARLLGSSSTVEIAERLSVGVAEDEGLGVLLDRPGRRSPPAAFIAMTARRGCGVPPKITPRRFPPPWSVEETSACFIVRDSAGQALAYVYCEDKPGRRSAAQFLTSDEGAKKCYKHC
jgi:hypothetical protein